MIFAIIGKGTIQYPKSSNYVVLTFQNLESIQKIVSLINGKMRTCKIEALHRLIHWLNNKLNKKNNKIWVRL